MARKGVIQREYKRQLLFLKYNNKRNKIKQEIKKVIQVVVAPSEQRLRHCFLQTVAFLRTQKATAMKHITKNNSKLNKERQKLYQELQKLPRNSNIVRLHNRCYITGRSKGFYRDFGISRHFLRSLAHEGYLPGVKKSSW